MPDNDHRALIEQARVEHHPILASTSAKNYCDGCKLSRYPCLTTRLADALEQESERYETLARVAGVAMADMRTHGDVSKHDDYRAALTELTDQIERDIEENDLVARIELEAAERERDAARSALTTVLYGMRSSWWANDHPDWIRAMENALAATKEEPRDGN